MAHRQAARAAARPRAPSSSLHHRAPRGFPECAPLTGREREQLGQAIAQSGNVAGLRRDEVAQLGRVLARDPGRDLGEAGVRGEHRGDAGGGGLGGDHAEGLGEDRRNDGGVAEREEMDEVAVLERAGEERACGACASSSAR